MWLKTRKNIFSITRWKAKTWIFKLCPQVHKEYVMEVDDQSMFPDTQAFSWYIGYILYIYIYILHDILYKPSFFPGTIYKQAFRISEFSQPASGCFVWARSPATAFFLDLWGYQWLMISLMQSSEKCSNFPQITTNCSMHWVWLKH